MNLKSSVNRELEEKMLSAMWRRTMMMEED